MVRGAGEGRLFEGGGYFKYIRQRGVLIRGKLHDSHIGLLGCLCRARETVYWPGMNAEITDYIQKCDVCTSLQSNQSN